MSQMESFVGNGMSLALLLQGFRNREIGFPVASCLPEIHGKQIVHAAQPAPKPERTSGTMPEKEVKMIANRLKVFFVLSIFLTVMAGPARALTLNAGETLSARLESRYGFDAFSFFWKLDSWNGDMDYRVYSPDPANHWAVHHELEWLDNHPSDTAAEFRADFLVGFNMDPFNGDVLNIEFSVDDGYFEFEDVEYSNTEINFFDVGLLAAAIYSVPNNNVSNWSVRETQDVTIYSIITETPSGYDVSPVPEPATWILLASGVVGLAVIRVRGNNKG